MFRAMGRVGRAGVMPASSAPAACKSMHSDGKCQGTASNLSIDCMRRAVVPVSRPRSGTAASLRRENRVEVDVGKLGA